MANKPYHTPTYEEEEYASRVSISKQVQAYVQWLVKHGKHHCYVYPRKKTPTAISNRTRNILEQTVGFSYEMQYIEVEPEQQLGKITLPKTPKNSPQQR